MFPLKCITTDRKPFVVRYAAPGDLEPVLALQRVAMGEADEYFVRTLGEFDREREEAAGSLADLLRQDNSVWLIAELDGELVGSLDLHGGRYARIRHVGHFGMTVRADDRNRGIGASLLEGLVVWAHEHPTLEKLSTTLFTTNGRAINLATKFGFRSEGRRHREFLVAPGRYLDAVILSRWMK